MERIPVSMATSAGRRASPDGRGLGTIIEGLVATVRQERYDQLRCRFESAVADALGWRCVQLTSTGGGGAGHPAVREGAGGLIPIPGTMAALRYEGTIGWGSGADDGVAAATLAGLAALTLELERVHAAGARVPRRPSSWHLVGSSQVMEQVRQRVGQVARTLFPVLVEGESGVGKEVVARLIHEQSRRARGPFVAVNCAAIVDSLLEAELFGIEDRTATGVRGRRGKFELADGGTLFLDEIGDLSHAAQAKLLRVLQDYVIERVGGHTSLSVNVRVIAATNRPLARLVEEGGFRADLFYRLNGVEIGIPPLRERLQDLPELVSHVLSRHREYGVTAFDPEALEALGHYGWPGNVRELERVVERAIALSPGELVRLEHLPYAVTERFREVHAVPLRTNMSLREMGAQYVRLVLAKCGNNKREACRVLDISYHTLESYIRRSAVVRGALPAGRQPSLLNAPGEGAEPDVPGRDACP
jgi:transcriptional regulator with PAS, ATPase and Fis domain